MDAPHSNLVFFRSNICGIFICCFPYDCATGAGVAVEVARQSPSFRKHTSSFGAHFRLLLETQPRFLSLPRIVFPPNLMEETKDVQIFFVGNLEELPRRFRQRGCCSPRTLHTQTRARSVGPRGSPCPSLLPSNPRVNGVINELRTLSVLTTLRTYQNPPVSHTLHSYSKSFDLVTFLVHDCHDTDLPRASLT